MKFLISAFLALVPAVAFAHGEEIIFLPVGQFIALVPVVIIAVRFTRGLIARAVITFFSFAVPFIFWWEAPNYLMPRWVFASEVSSFLTGFVVSILAGVVITFLFRKLQRGSYYET